MFSQFFRSSFFAIFLEKLSLYSIPGPTPELTDAPQPRPCPTPEPAIAPHPCPTLEPTSLHTVGEPTYVPTAMSPPPRPTPCTCTGCSRSPRRV